MTRTSRRIAGTLSLSLSLAAHDVLGCPCFLGDCVADQCLCSTGVVHQAPAFGEDDFRVCTREGIVPKGCNVPCPVDANGRFAAPVNEWVPPYVQTTHYVTFIYIFMHFSLHMIDAVTEGYPREGSGQGHQEGIEAEGPHGPRVHYRAQLSLLLAVLCLSRSLPLCSFIACEICVRL